MPIALDQVPDIDFAVKDPLVVESEVLNDYELRFLALTQINKTLAPGDPTRLLLLVGAHWIVHDRVDIDFTGKMNLLKYSRGDYLDNVAALYGERTLRLKPARSVTVLRFTLTQSLPFTALIPINTRVTSDGDAVFETIYSGIIPAGEMYVDLPAQCIIGGPQFNDIAIGQISTLIDWNQTFAVTVSNIERTVDGSGREEDEHYRDRVWLAPESLSTCGPILGYSFWGKSTHPGIIDVGVYSAPEVAGEVHLFPLMTDGELPSPEVLEEVLEICNYKKRRPLTDYVFVHDPTPHYFELELTVWLWQSDQTIATEIMANVWRAVQQWLLWTRSKVGRDIIPSQLVRLIQEAGVKRVEVFREARPGERGAPAPAPPGPPVRISPGDQVPPSEIPPPPAPELTIPSPPYIKLQYWEVGWHAGDPVINFGGFENGLAQW